MKKTICLDFDGVCNTYSGWQGEEELFEPRQGLQMFLVKLQTHFNEIVIHSTREPEKIKMWLAKYSLLYLISGVYDKKPPASVYLDDRGITFKGNYDDVFDQIIHFIPYWMNPK